MEKCVKPAPIINRVQNVLAEVMEKYQFSDDEIIVNVQGDEPFIPPENIAQVASNLANQHQNSHVARMSTLAIKINSVEEAF